MKEYLTIVLSFLIGLNAHHEVHLVPAHKICPDVTGDHDILLPDPKDCSVYYRCENGTAVPQSCPPGLAWCQILQNCTLPILANCTLSHTIVTYSPKELVTYNPNSTTTENPVTGPTTSSETCPKDGASFPNPEDCRKYYKCKKGKPHPERCPGKKRYSTWLGICIAPEIANCINVGTQENKTCPVNGARNVYPSDCSKYYECVGNTVEIKQCPSGKEYNKWFKDCYSPELAYCHTYTTVNPTTSPTTIQTPGPDNTCPEYGYKLPNPLNCTTYYVCENNSPTLQNCPTGFEYSCWDQECLPPSDGQCLPTQGQSCKNSEENLPNSQDCHSYFECKNGTTVKKYCKHGLQYNSWFKKCVRPNVAHCKVEEPTTPTTSPNPPHTPSPSETSDICPIAGAKLPDPLDCHSYYICKNETPVKETCPQNMEYSCWDQECLPAEAADCIDNINQTGHACKSDNTTMPNIYDCSSYYKCKNGEVVLLNCDNGLEFNAWYGKCVNSSLSHCNRSTTENPHTTPTTPITPNFLCPQSGLKYPSSKYCNAYMICDSNRQLKTVQCNPSTFHYNCETKKCENMTHCCSHSTETMPPSTEGSITTTPNGGLTETTTPTGGSTEATASPGGSTSSSSEPSVPTGGSTEATASPGGSTSSSSEPSVPTGGSTEATASPGESTGSSSETSVPSGGSTESTASPGGSTGSSSETSAPTGGSTESTASPGESTGSSSETSAPTGGSTESTASPGESTCSSSETSVPTGGSTESTASPGESTGSSSETSVPTGGSTESTASPGGSTGSSSEISVPSGGSTESTASPGGSTGSSSETSVPSGGSTESTASPGGSTGSSSETSVPSGGSTESTASPGGSTGSSSETSVPSGGSTESTASPGGSTGSSSETSEPSGGSTESTASPGGSTGSSSETNVPSGGSTESTASPGGSTGSSSETSVPSGGSTESTASPGGSTGSSSETSVPSGGSTESTASPGGSTGSSSETSVPSGGSTESTASPGGSTGSSSETSEPSGGSTESTASPGGSTGSSSETNVPSGGSTESTASPDGSTGSSSETSVPSGGSTESTASPGGSTGSSSETSVPSGGSTESTASPGGSTGSSSETSEPSGGSTETTASPGGSTGSSSETSVPSGGSTEATASPGGSTGSSSETSVPSGGSTETTASPGGSTGSSSETNEPSGGSTETTASPGGSTGSSSETSVPSGGSTETTASPGGSTGSSSETSVPSGGSTETTASSGGSTGSSSETSVPTGGLTGISSETSVPSGGSTETTSSPAGSSGSSSETSEPSGGSTETTASPGGSTGSSSETSVPSGGPTESTASPGGSTGSSSETNVPTGGPIETTAPPGGSTGISSETNVPTDGSSEITVSTGGSSNSSSGTSVKPPSILCSKPDLQYPSSEYCNAYMKCDINQQLITVECNPSTFHYNCETKKCENITHCCSPTTQTMPPPTGTTSKIITTPTTPPGPTDPTAPSEGNNVCPTEGALIPNPLDCSTYYKCIKGEPVLQKCPEGNKYSCWDQQCEPDNEATCVSEGGQDGKNCSVEGLRTTDVTNCNNYYECNNGKIVLKHCPHGEEFNANFQKCYKPKLAHCRKHTTITPKPKTTPSGPTDPTAPSEGNNVCPTEGALIPNPLDCSTYYKCIKGEPVLQKCPEGNKYSCWDQQCEPDNEATCVSEGGQDGKNCSVEGLRTTDVTNCNNYYECHNGKVVLKHCPHGEEFNANFQKCYKPKLAHCRKHTTITPKPKTTPSGPTDPTAPSEGNNVCPTEGALIPNPLDCSTYYKCIKGEPVLQKCPEGNKYSCWDQQCEPDNEATCVSEGGQDGKNCSVEGLRTTDVTNCNNYYECHNGKVVLKHCPHGEEFNANFQKCYKPKLAHCRKHTTITPKPKTTPSGPTDPTAPSEGNNVCPTEGALIPNPLDCSTYYKCIKGEPVLQKCPEGNKYSCWDQQCEPDNEATCVSEGGQDGKNCSVEGLRTTDVTNCNNYYECNNGKIVLKHCPHGEEFNANFQKCYKPKLAHCRKHTTITPNPKTTPSGPTDPTAPSEGNNVCPTEGALIPNPLDCSTYYKCIKGEPVLQKCPEGNKYSCWDQQCEPDNEATCVSEGGQDGKNCSVEGLRTTDVTNCNNYYECHNGKVVLKHCPHGEEFNANFQKCYKPKLAHCRKHTTITPKPKTTPSGPTDPTAPSEGNNVCPTEGALIPNPLDCSTYYKCIKGEPVLQKCPEGNKYSCWDQQCEPDNEATCVSEGGQDGKNCSVEGLRTTDVTNCNNYYECHNGKVVLKHCPHGEEFNANFQKCYKPKLAHCRKHTTITPKPVTPTTPPTISPNTDLCPFEGSLLPNPLNCSTYYKCVNNTPVEQLCADGYEYSCWIQECKPHGEAQCITDEVQTNTSCKRNGQQIQNPRDCHSYYACENGKVQEKRCFLNWYYNKWFHICTPFKILGHCKPTTITVSPITLPTTTPGPSVINDICPKDGILLPDPQDCSRYYKCVNYKPTPQKCPSGQEYSCWDQKCKAASDAQCINAGIQLGQNCSRDGVKLQNLESCLSYYECVHGKVQKTDCSFGFQYNRWYERCVPFYNAHCKTYVIQTTVTTTPTTLTPTTKKHHILCPINGLKYPSTTPGDCGGYMECENYQPVKHECPLYAPTYNCETKKCEFQWGTPHCCAPPIET